MPKSTSSAPREVPGLSLIKVHPEVKIGDTRGRPLPGLATDLAAVPSPLAA